MCNIITHWHISSPQWEVPGLFSTRPFSTRHFSTRHISTKALLYQDISLPWTPLYQDTFLPRHISTMNTFLPMTLLYPDTSLPQTLVYPIVKSDTSLPLTLLYLLLKKTPVYLGTLLLRDIKYNLLYKENGGNIKPGPTLFSVRDAHLLHYPTYKKLCFLNVHYRWKCGHKIDCFCHNFGRNGLIELIFLLNIL